MDIPSLVQARSIIARTPLGDALTFRQMHGHEGLSQLFEFEVELLADNFNLDLKQLLGKPLTLEIATSSFSTRYLSGQIVRCMMVGRENSTSRNYIYKATVKPWLWYLTQTSDNKIFQQKTIPDIIKEVLGEYNYSYELKLSGSYRAWEYCVQYQETDFAFICRLMEHEGIYYYFKHDKNQHTLVMTDDSTTLTPAPGYETIPYYGPDRVSTPQEEYISMWEVSAQVTPDGYATVDYDFTKPGANLDAMSKRSGGSEAGNLEIFEWQGGFQEAQHGEQYARVRLEELQSVQERDQGLTTARGLAPGHLFTLKSHPRQAENREYLVVSASYRMSVAGYASDSGMEEFFETSFSALPSNIQYRTPRVTPIPYTHGPQTARVVGPTGEEIWTDKYGRIKVQFHWDRYGHKNENSSCWVRVSSPWAGGGFGGLQLPRIGDEVVVDFIGGCPDRPIVLGRVYNANNMPPVELPANADQSGFRSKTVHGDPNMYNALIFTDTHGSEKVDLRAQKDFFEEIGHDKGSMVHGSNRTQIAQHNMTIIGEDLTHEQAQAIDAQMRQEMALNADNGVYNITTVRGPNTTTIDGKNTTTIGGGSETTVSGGLNHGTYNNSSQTDVTGTNTTTVTGGLNHSTFNSSNQTDVTGTSTTTVTGGLNHSIFNSSNQTDITGTNTTTVTGGLNHSIYNSSNTTEVTGTNTTQVTGTNVTKVMGDTATLAISNFTAAAVSSSNSGIAMLLSGKTLSFELSSLWVKGNSTDLSVTKEDIAAVKNEISEVNSRVTAVKNQTSALDFKTGVLERKAKGVAIQITQLHSRVSALESVS